MPGADFAKRSWPALVLPAVVVAVTAGMWAHPGWWGNEDWDYFAHHYEAMRRSVLVYHQVPWWNPWSCGGIPLAANPQLGLVSLNFPLVLAFGTYPGLKLALLVHLILAAEGVWWLAGSCMRDPVARATSALVYVANGAVALYAAAGHLGIELVAWIPWAIGWAFRLERDGRAGFFLGLVLAAATLTSFQYFLTYLFLVLGAVVAWRLVAADATGRHRIVEGCAFAATTLVAFAGMGIALAAELVADFPRARAAIIPQAIDAGGLATMLLRPGQSLAFRPAGATGLGLGWHEYGCYLGVPAALVFLASLRGGWRWWHTLAVAGFWLALGNTRWWEPSTWLADLPVLGGLRVASRWRVVGALGVALACGAVLDEWRASPRRALRLAALPVAAAIALDLGLAAFPVYRDAFPNRPTRIERESPGDEFVQAPTLPIAPGGGPKMLALLLANEGAIYGYEPFVGRDEAAPASSRLWRGHPDYRGEYWSAAGPVALERWSPNAIRLRAAPGAWIEVNQNPGSYWLQDGRRAFPGLRSVDRHAAFRVRANTRGIVDLRVWPTAWRRGLWLAASGMVGLALALRRAGRFTERGGSR